MCFFKEFALTDLWSVAPRLTVAVLHSGADAYAFRNWLIHFQLHAFLRVPLSISRRFRAGDWINLDDGVW